MLDKTATRFSHVKPADTAWRPDGLRDFFLYKNLGVTDATAGRVIAHLVKANMAPEKGTGWHRHEAVRALPFRLLARHGVPRNRRPGRLHVDQHAGADTLGVRRAEFTRTDGEPPPARQKSMSSSSMSSGSSFAAATHSFISGSAMMVWQ